MFKILANQSLRKFYDAWQLKNEGKEYHINILFTLPDKEHVDIVIDAAKQVVKHNAVWQQTFFKEGNDLFITFHKDLVPEIHHYEIDQNDKKSSLINKLANQPHDLNNKAAIKINIIKDKVQNNYTVHINIHHILLDGSGMNLFMDQLNQTIDGKDLPVIDARSYIERIKTTVKPLSNFDEALYQNYVKKVAYARESFDYQPVKNPEEIFHDIKILNSKLKNKIGKFAKDNSISPFNVLLILWAIFDSKINNRTSTLLNYPVNLNRDKSLQGCFVNNVILPFHLEKDDTFGKIMAKFKLEFSEYKNLAKVDVSDLITKLDLNAGIGFFSYSPAPNLGSLKIKGINYQSELIPQLANSSYGMAFCEVHDDLYFIFECYQEAFTDPVKNDLLDRFFNFIDKILSKKDSLIAEIDLLQDSDTKTLLKKFNSPIQSYQKDQTILEVFDKVVRKYPDKIALKFKDQEMTYQQLDQFSEELAHHLTNQNVLAGDIVSVWLKNSIEMIPAIFGALKAGAAFLPLAYDTPLDRVQYILKDSKSKILLSDSELTKSLKTSTPIMDVKAIERRAEKYSRPCLRPDSVAYVIYTSGSTGKPKGTLIEHKSVINCVNHLVSQFTLDDKTIGAKYAGFGFDASIIEIFPPLLVGGKLCFIKEEEKLDVYKVNHFYHMNRINFAFLPTQFAELFFELDNKTLEILLVGGDKLRRFQPTPYKVVNLYGPTETTVYVTDFIVDRQYPNIPIGRPITNVRCYVLDANQNLLPIGATGELYVGGKCLAKGYLNKTELTKEKFIPNPFQTKEERKLGINSRLYRSGDLVRWLEDGNLEFIGRNDFQVKIRGFRIETGEIESCLEKISGIDQALVLALSDRDDNKYLCAYYTSKNELEIEKIKDFLGKQLASYMIPDHIIHLERFPTNTSGKVDRKSLPKPDFESILEKNHLSPINAEQEFICSKFTEILGLKKVGINDDFFNLGGNSIKAIRLTASMEEKFKVTVVDIFNLRTPAKLALLTQTSANNTIGKAPKKEYYPASHAQERMFVTNQIGEGDISYNIPNKIKITGKLDIDLLDKALDKLTSRHESLRTVFKVVNNQVVQVVRPQMKPPKNVQIAREDELDSILMDFIRPFDLTTGPLFRFKIIKVHDELHYLFFDAHHIIFDGGSRQPFLNDLGRLCANVELMGPKVSYIDYAEWQRHGTGREAFFEQEQYWLNRFKSTDIEALNLPLDFPRTSSVDYAGDAVCQNLPKSVTDKLKELGTKNGMTLYTIFLTALNILLYRYTGQKDIILGCVTNGRNKGETQDLVGMFVNTLPMLTRIDSQMTTDKLLKEGHQNILDMISNQDYQMEDLIKKLGLKSDIRGRNPLFDVIFDFEFSENEVPFDHLTFGYDKLDFNQIAKFDLSFNATDQEDKLNIEINYRKALFKKPKMEKLLTHYINILTAMAQNINTPIKDLKLLSQRETEEILYHFNDTFVDYNLNKTLVDVFNRSAQKYPNNQALTYNDESFTYKELDECTTKVAKYIRKEYYRITNSQLTKDTMIGLCVDRSPEMIIGLLAILKSGAAYVPIAPDYPKDRIEHLLQDTNSKICITHSNLLNKLKLSEIKNPPQYLAIDKVEGSDEPLPPISEEALAYVIYTSGSTGKPKGVMIEHRTVINHIEAQKNNFDILETDAILQFSPIIFDASVEQIWLAFANGAKLVLCDKATLLDNERFNDYIEKHQVNHIDTVPTFLDSITFRNKKRIKNIVTGGEACSKELVRKYQDINLINEYGPTETTITSHRYEVTKKGQSFYGNTVPIGKSLDNITSYILDKDLNPLPIGIAGELYIGGECLARGYLNRKELTKERFIPNPFQTKKQKELGINSRLYRTGDLVRWLDDGNIEFIGRNDFQVKIRGYRIELGEIEDLLRNIPEITGALVKACGGSEENAYLCAYYTAANELKREQIKKSLNKHLPDYMVPDFIIYLESFPLTVNGKIDRKSLPNPNTSKIASRSYEPPVNELQKLVCDIFAEVLGVEKVGINDDLFNLGGTSIKALSIVTKLQEYFKVNISDIFNLKTPTKIAKLDTAANLLKEVNGRDKILTIPSKANKDGENNKGNTKVRFDNIKKVFDDVKISPEILQEMQNAKSNYQSSFQNLMINTSKRKPIRNVLLTGVTGFLGCHLLYQLLKTDNYFVYVLIRATTDKDAQSRLLDKCRYYFGDELNELIESRVKVYPSDLESPQLGLKKPDYNYLCKEVDSVIHAAAMVKHYGEYQSFFKSNVVTTMNLIDLAKHTGLKDFHYISTHSVCNGGYIPGKEHHIYTEYDMPTEVVTNNVYLRTKFEGEMACIAARKQGVKVNIYRVGNLTFNSKNYRNQENIDDNGFYNRLKTMLKVGFIPSPLDEEEISPVDLTALAIVKLFDKVDTENQVFHVYNPNKNRLSQLLNHKELKLNIKPVGLEQFVNAINKALDEKNMRRQIELFLLHQGWLEHHEDEKQKTAISIYGDRTTYVLKQLGFSWSAIKPIMFSELVAKALGENRSIVELQNKENKR